MTCHRYELTDREWLIIAPLLPTRLRGVHRCDDRWVLSGILWRFRTGSPSAEILGRYGLRLPAAAASSGGGKLVCWGPAS